MEAIAAVLGQGVTHHNMHFSYKTNAYHRNRIEESGVCAQQSSLIAAFQKHKIGVHADIWVNMQWHEKQATFAVNSYIGSNSIQNGDLNHGQFY